MLNGINDQIDITSIGGPTTIWAGGGNDVMRVNYDSHDAQTFQNGIGGLLTLHGGAGSDIYDIGLSGQPGPTGAKLTTIDVADAAPASDGGINQLYIYGTEQPRLLPPAREPGGRPADGDGGRVPRRERRDADPRRDDGARELRRLDQRRPADLRPRRQRHVRARRQPRPDDDLRRRRQRHVPDRPAVRLAARRVEPEQRPRPGRLLPDDPDDAGLPLERRLVRDDDLRRRRQRLVHRLPQPRRALPLRPGRQRHVRRPRLRQGEPERPAGAVHEHQRRRRRRLHLLHRRRAGADRRRRRSRHARRPRHRLRRHLRRHRQGRLRRRPLHHLHRCREGRRRRPAGQRHLLRPEHEPERAPPARRLEGERHVQHRRRHDDADHRRLEQPPGPQRARRPDALERRHQLPEPAGAVDLDERHRQRRAGRRHLAGLAARRLREPERAAGDDPEPLLGRPRSGSERGRAGRRRAVPAERAGRARRRQEHPAQRLRHGGDAPLHEGELVPTADRHGDRPGRQRRRGHALHHHPAHRHPGREPE